LICLTSNVMGEQRDTAEYKFPSITVTAARISDSLLKIPLAISIVDQSSLSHQSANGIDRALASVPGVLAQSRSGDRDVRLTIRGYGARGAGERSNAGTARGLRVMLDGFPLTEPDGRTSFDLLDLSSAGRVEVVRSNSSALWGNASGGVLNLISDVDYLNPHVDLQSLSGSYGYQKQVFDVATLLGNGRLFFNLSRTKNDGWRQHSGSSRELVNTGIVTPVGNKTSLGIYLTMANNLFRIPGPLTRAQFEDDPRQAQADTVNYKPTYVERDERRHNRQGRLGVRLAHEFDSSRGLTAMLFVEPKYLQRSERNTFRDFTRYHVGGNFTFRNSSAFSPTVKNLLLVGTDEAYQDGAILFYNLENGNRGSELRDNKREGANNFGAFIQNEMTFSGRLGVTVGARYDNLTYYSDSYIDPKLDAKKSFEQITPKGGVNYRFGADKSIYLNVGGGVEIPAGNETDPPSTSGEDTLTAINPLLEPIRSTTFEVGTKGMMASNQSWLEGLSYDVAVYLIEVRNDIIPYRGGRFYFTAGKTRRAGIEIGSTLYTTAGLSFTGAFTYSQNRYLDYLVDSVHYGRPGQTADYKDNKQAGVPEMFYRVAFRYSSRSLRNAFAEIGAQGVGSYFVDDANTIRVGSYNVADATVGVDGLPLMGERLRLRGFVTVANVFNRRYAASAFVNPDLDRNKQFPIYLEPGMPRNWVGSLSVTWNFQ
ncbi:MAG: TonB-dependent receptor, partial [candidate division Zixibacteria bacterium]|nr:TonB-dependent receptor [candidate division Zixibacteria bacterium]